MRWQLYRRSGHSLKRFTWYKWHVTSNWSFSVVSSSSLSRRINCKAKGGIKLRFVVTREREKKVNDAQIFRWSQLGVLCEHYNMSLSSLVWQWSIHKSSELSLGEWKLNLQSKRGSVKVKVKGEEKSNTFTLTGAFLFSIWYVILCMSKVAGGRKTRQI